MTITIESVRTFIGGSAEVPLYPDSEFTRAITIAATYVRRLLTDGVNLTPEEAEQVQTLKAALTVTLGKTTAGDGGSSTANTEPQAISQVKDGDVTISYATSKNSETYVQTLTRRRAMWKNAINAIIDESDEGAVAVDHDF